MDDVHGRCAWTHKCRDSMDDESDCASVTRGQEPEVTVGGRATQDAVAEDAEALPGGRLNAQNVNLLLREP